MWRILAGINSRIKLNSGYYDCLSRMHEDGIKEYEHIIKLDVKRTGELVVTPEFAVKLTRILTSYAKWAQLI